MIGKDQKALKKTELRVNRGGDEDGQSMVLYLQHSCSEVNAGTGDGFSLKSHKHISAKAVIHIVPATQKVNHKIAISLHGLFIYKFMYEVCHMMQIKRPNINGGLSLTLSFPSLPHVPLLLYKYKRVKASMQCGRAHVQCTCAHRQAHGRRFVKNRTGSTSLHATNY